MTMRGHQSLLDAGPIMPLGGLVRECPIDIALRLGLEAGVVEQVGEREKAVEEVRAALPGLAGAAEPAAVGADVGPGFVEVAAESVGLNLEAVP